MSSVNVAGFRSERGNRLHIDPTCHRLGDLGAVVAVEIPASRAEFCKDCHITPFPAAEWTTQAACGPAHHAFWTTLLGELVDNSWWMPEFWWTQSPPRGTVICAQCPVQRECTAHAVSSDELFGLWGAVWRKPPLGTNPAPRRWEASW